MSFQGVVADTHTIIWYVDAPAHLTVTAATALDNAADDAAQRIYISAISWIEMHYLTEKSRIHSAVCPKSWRKLTIPNPFSRLFQLIVP